MTEVTLAAGGSRDLNGASSEAPDALRSNLYALLANLTAGPPSADLLEALATIEVPEDAADTPIGEAWAMLRSAAEKTSVESAADEYQDVFVGIGRGEVMPYGSWYLTGFLMEKPLAVLRADLEQLGFRRQENVTESEDHIAALCDVMGMISAQADGADMDEQSAFFGAHVAPWAGQFFQDLQNAASARLYRVVGFLGERFIDVETKYLEVTPNPVERRAVT